jgi:transcriptional regulator with XRE-family HTH domain
MQPEKQTENPDNPLHRLRVILTAKDPGESTEIGAAESGPMTQAQLAELCDISRDTIQSIEYGRRVLTDALLQKIAMTTGASWSPEQGQWTEIRTGRTFTRTSFELYWLLAMRRPRGWQKQVNVIHNRIDALFERVPEESYGTLRARIHYFLEACKRDFGVKGLDDITRDLTNIGSIEFFTPTEIEEMKKVPKPPRGRKPIYG